jgi:pimeloyl-ACP methyl ester carboxylesterase
MIPAARHWTTPGGLRLVGEALGPEGAPSVVLLHGGGQTRHAWAGSMRRMAADGYCALAYDTRGHGDSDWAADGDYAVPALAGDLRCVLDGMPAPAAIIGASLGGLTGYYAIATADRPMATALVLVDVVLRPSRAGFERTRAFMTGNQDGFANLDEAAAAISAFNPERKRPANPAGLRKYLRQRADGRFYWHWDPRVSDQPVDARADQLISVAPRMTVPTLLVHGEHSEVVDAAGVAELRRHIPQIEVLELADAGHMIAGDHNDAFMTGVAGFLAGTAASTNPTQH